MIKRTYRVMAGLKMPVFAIHHEGSINKKTVLAAHKCKCGTRLVMNRLQVPSCLVCSNTTLLDNSVPAQDNELILTKDEVSEMPVVANCSTCGSTVRAVARTARAMHGQSGHCMICSTVLAFDGSAVMDDDGDHEFHGTESDDEEDDSEEDSSEEDDDSEEEDTSMEDDLEEEDDDDSEEYDSSSVVAEGDEEDTGPLDEPNPVDLVDPSDVDVEDDVDAEVAPEVSEEDEELAMASVKKQGKKSARKGARKGAVTVSVFNKVLKAATTADVDLLLSSDGTRWYMFANNQHVATASLDRASDSIKKIFTSEDFATTLQIATENGITEENVQPFGFEPVNVEVSVDDATEDKMNKAIDEATAALDARSNSITEALEQCIGIAAVGINKGVFAEINNPLRIALVAKLSELRVRNPEKVVDTVLAEHGEDLLREIVAKAVELTKKTPEVLDEIGKMVSQASYRFVEASGDEDKPPTTVIPFMAQSDKEHAVNAGVASGSPDPQMASLIRDINTKRWR